MVTNDAATPTPTLGRGLSRRTALGGLGGGLLAAGLGGLPRGASAQAATAQAAPGLPLVTGVFVGTVPELDAYIAVVASIVEADAGPREVATYLCDGVGLNAWFTGLAAGNLAGMSSDQHRLELLLTPDAAVGVVTSATGAPLTVTVPAANGIAGLYDVTLTEDGTLSGPAVGGDAELTGRLVEVLADGRRLSAGRITRPGGERQAWAGFCSPAAKGALRFIVLPTGQIKGGGKKGGGEGFMKTDTNF